MPSSKPKTRSRDVVAEVIAYDLANQTLLARNVSTGRDLQVTLHPEVVTRATEHSKDQPPRAYDGYLIDERLAAKLPPGHRILLQGADVEPTPTHGKRQRGPAAAQRCTARWIHSLAEPEATLDPSYPLVRVSPLPDRLSARRAAATPTADNSGPYTPKPGA